MMSNRVTKLYDMFVDTYDDIPDVEELFEALIIECPEADDQEMVDFVVDLVIEHKDEVPHLDDAIADFTASWGRKTL